MQMQEYEVQMYMYLNEVRGSPWGVADGILIFCQGGRGKTNCGPGACSLRTLRRRSLGGNTLFHPPHPQNILLD